MKNNCFQLNRKFWVTMAMLLALALPSLAQKITVTGHVTDDQVFALLKIGRAHV